MKKLLCIALCLACLSLTSGRKRERIETPMVGATFQAGFNEGQGVKSWGYPLSGGVTYNATWGYGFGLMGAGYTFNGTNAYINLQNSENSFDITTGDFSISAWVKPDAASTGKPRDVFDKRQAAEPYQGYLFGIERTGKAYFEIRDQNEAGVNVTSLTTIATEEWTHVVAVAARAGNGSIYINGALNNSASFVAADGSLLNDSVVNLGWHNPGMTTVWTNFMGEMDEIYFFKRAISAEEVGALYEHGKANMNP